MRKPVILVFCDYYLPGTQSGGALRTLENMVEYLGDRFEFRFVTRDRDINSTVSYPSVRIGDWNVLTRESVYYAPPSDQSIYGMARILRNTPHSAIYLNSFFSLPFSVFPLLAMRLGLAPRRPVLLAPRGELSQGALANKVRGKTAFLKITRWFGIYRGIEWQASTVLEQAELARWFGPKARVTVACDFPAKPSQVALERRGKHRGEVRLVFLSRIDFKKNLLGALEMASRLRGNITFDIYGPVADAPYWEVCRDKITKMPAHVVVRHLGQVDTRQVERIFSRYDLFLFPTLGENFGHVILESLSAGTPVLLSDRTPWNELETEKVGWSVPLNEPERFDEILHRMVDMGPEEYGIMSANAVRYALRVKENPGIFDENLAMFSALLLKAEQTTLAPDSAE